MEKQEFLDEQETGDSSPPESALKYASERGLVPTTEPDYERNGKKVFRAEGFEGIVPLAEIKERIAEVLKYQRDRNDLSQVELAALLGITAQVWGRYERAVSSLEVNRLIVLCEQLNFNPLEMLAHTSPHLFGNSHESAQTRIEIIRLIGGLPDDICLSLLDMVKQIDKLNRPVRERPTKPIRPR